MKNKTTSKVVPVIVIIILFTMLMLDHYLLYQRQKTIENYGKSVRYYASSLDESYRSSVSCLNALESVNVSLDEVLKNQEATKITLDEILKTTELINKKLDHLKKMIE